MNVFSRVSILSALLLVLSISVSAASGASEQNAKVQKAVFAGGCFWCMEPPYDKLDGVISTTSGYMGGEAAKANYKAVSSGNTKHVEVIEVVYDPAKVSYETLLDVFWKNVDPFDNRGQFCDKGPQYKSYIYYGSDEEKALALKSLETRQTELGKAFATKVVAAAKFYPAEDYHQNYYQRNPIRYKFYRTSCGRDNRLKEVWGDK